MQSSGLDDDRASGARSAVRGDLLAAERSRGIDAAGAVSGMATARRKPCWELEPTGWRSLRRGREVFPAAHPVASRVGQGHADDEPGDDGGQARGFAGQEAGPRQNQWGEKRRELDDRHKEEAARIHGGVYEPISGFVSFESFTPSRRGARR